MESVERSYQQKLREEKNKMDIYRREMLKVEEGYNEIIKSFDSYRIVSDKEIRGLRKDLNFMRKQANTRQSISMNEKQKLLEGLKKIQMISTKKEEELRNGFCLKINKMQLLLNEKNKILRDSMYNLFIIQ